MIGSRVMLDTQILIFQTRDLTSPKAAKWGPDVHDMIRRSKDIVAQLPSLRVSAVVAFEFMRALKPDALQAAENIVKRFQIEPFDAPVAFRAAAMMSKRVYTLKACPECLNLDVDHACKRCQRNVSKVQRLNDAIIAATADVLADVDTLYTFDRGILAFAPEARGVKISEPPSGHGPLWDRHQAVLDAGDEATTPAAPPPVGSPSGRARRR